MFKVLCLSLVVFTFQLSWGQEEDPFDVQLGEKLFKDDRFSHSFFNQNQGQWNSRLPHGDAVLENLTTPSGLVPHPLKGQQISCASCHMVDQAHSSNNPHLVFAYNDFDSRSLIPKRSDAGKKTLRNSMNMVISTRQEGKPLHWDGEFFSGKDLTCATLVGRNMGWLPQEQTLAKKHIVDVLRKDDGSYPLDTELHESYQKNFAQLGINLSQLSDQEVREQVCQTIAIYMQSLDFTRDSQGHYSGTAYDQFLKVNGLRRGPRNNETPQHYLQYLRDQLNYKKQWKFVGASPLNYHNHDAKFGELELRGMKTFFTRGQCVSCHQPPDFTDFNFHNTGVSQIEYDQVHGGGAFSQLKWPDWEQRQKQSQKYLTATAKHPQWQGVFAQEPVITSLEAVDLGVWNVIGHPDKQSVQKQLKANLCESARHPDCSNWAPDDYLSYSLGAFKTTTLRTLGQTGPYLHNGMGKDLRQVLRLYFAASHMARDGRLVNADPMLKAMHIMPHDFEALEAFLGSLDEDYD